MNLLGAPKERKTQLYFRDDNSFEFIKRDLKFGCLVEMVGEKLNRAWKHFYSCQIPFPGYKNIQADTIVLGFSRDIILDVFNKVPQGTDPMQKPDVKKSDSMKKWRSNIAEQQRQIYYKQRETNFWTSRVTWVLIGVLVVMVLLWAIRFVKVMYA